METGEENDESPKEVAVRELLAAPGEDNSDSSGLDTNGYKLNGAFRFTIDRENNRAYLEPTEGLLVSSAAQLRNVTSGTDTACGGFVPDPVSVQAAANRQQHPDRDLRDAEGRPVPGVPGSDRGAVDSDGDPTQRR